MSATTIPAQVEVAVGRSAVYAFLTHGFAYPSSDHVARLVDDLAPMLRQVEFAEDTGMRAAIDDCVAALARDRAVLAPAHQRLFTIIESRDCPTYETAYRGRDIHRQGNIMADVAGFYRAHGLTFGGPERERPDHIAVELEFMSFLAAKEAIAHVQLGREEVAACRYAQELFLAEHLGTWGPGFGRRVELAAEPSFYRTLGLLLHTWLECDIREFGVRPAEIVDRPLPQPPPDDGACGVDQPVWPVPLQRRRG